MRDACLLWVAESAYRGKSVRNMARDMRARVKTETGLQATSCGHAYQGPEAAVEREAAVVEAHGEASVGTLGADGARASQGTEESECTICLEGQSTHACAPCGHLCVCGDETCHAIIMRDAICPVCRAETIFVMPVYKV